MSAAVPPTLGDEPSEQDLSERRLQQSFKMRGFLGLATRRSHLRTLAANPNASLRLGMPVTPQEARVIDERLDLQDEITEAVRAIRRSRSVRSVYDGAWIDQGTGTTATAVFRTTGKPLELLDVIGGAFKDETSIRVVRSHRTLARLKFVHERVDASRQDLARSGVTIFGVTTDLVAEVVRVEAAGKPGIDPDQVLTKRFGVAIKVEPPTEASPMAATDFPPLKAGHRISSLSISCTAAFNVHYFPGDGLKHFGTLTAGHCGDNGEAWLEWNTSTVTGIMRGDSFDGDLTTTSDAAVIRDLASPLASNRLIQDSATERRVTALSQFGTGFDVQNAIICDYGYKTEEDCGYLESSSFSFEAANGKVLIKQRKAMNLNPCFGDSGGPVYGKSGSQATAVGITSHLFYPNDTPDGDGSINDPRCVRQLYSTYSHARHAIQDVGYEDDTRVYYPSTVNNG